MRRHPVASVFIGIAGAALIGSALSGGHKGSSGPKGAGDNL
ncbi:MAG: hypothetical protein WC793_01705 [Candidatus Paceibacterota bacterium]